MKMLNSQPLTTTIYPHFHKIPTGKESSILGSHLTEHSHTHHTLAEITYVYEEEQIDPESRNSALYYYYQIGSSSERSVMMSELFGHMIEEAAFDELRTKQQLGVSFTRSLSDCWCANVSPCSISFGHLAVWRVERTISVSSFNQAPSIQSSCRIAVKSF